MSLKRVIEAVTLPAAAETGVLIGEAVREAGLDPDLYLAVIPAEMGRAGRVNMNGRVYVPEELKAEHERLCREAAERFVEGGLGHSETGPTFDIPIRLLDGECVTESDGSLLAQGRVAVLNTQAGRDVLVLYRAGMPIGMSSDALARFTEQVIDAKSRYAKANPDFIGRKVVECSGLRLNKYDVVRVASAGTHWAPPPETSVTEAYQRVIESKCLPELGSDPATQAVTEQQESVPMEIKTLAALMAAYPELMAQHAQQVTEGLDPFAKLTPDQKAAVKVALEAVKTRPEAGADEAALLKAVREQADVDRARLLDLERGLQSAKESLAAETGARKALEEKLARAEARQAVAESLGDTWAKGRKGAEKIRAMVLEDFDAGRLKTVAEAQASAERLEKLVTESLALAAVPTGNPAPAVATPPAEGAVTEGKDSTLTPADKNQASTDPFADVINRLQ